MADLLQARQALQKNQLDRAIQLLLQVSSAQPQEPNVWFTLATALARKGGQQAMCCIAYHRTLQLLQAADAGQTQAAANMAMAAVSADNCWLLAEKLLPTAWPAALQDTSLNNSMHSGLLQHLQAVMQQQGPAHIADSDSADCSYVQLLCVGGMGVHAMQLAAAASDVQRRAVEAAEAVTAAGATASSSVPSMGLAFIPSGQLTAHVASQLLSDNDLDDIVDVTSWPEFMQQQREQDPPTAVLALLAGAVQPNWGPAVTACMQAMHRLAAFTSTCSSRADQDTLQCRVCPSVIRVWAVPVSCKELLDLNQVDLQASALRYDYRHANSRLRRNSRPAQVARHGPDLLAAPACVLEVSLQAVLQELQQRYQSAQQRQQGSGSTAGAAGTHAACAVAAALVAGRTADASTAVTVQQAGRVDCLVWWLEFEWALGHSTSFAPPAAAPATPAGSFCAGAVGQAVAIASSSNRDVLQPHVWQHVQYLQEAAASASKQQPQQQQQQQGAQLIQGQMVHAGQRLLLHVTATAADLQLTASLSVPADTAATAAPDPASTASTPQQRPGPSSSNPSREILPYHLSMLNDHARTLAYERGIAGAVRALLQQGQQQEGVAGSLQQLSLDLNSNLNGPVVLDVGCGTGLLSMMAATAAAALDRTVQITACEREPVLAQTAQQLIADNCLQQQIQVVQKLSNQLTLPTASGAAAAATAAAQASSGGKSSSKQQATQQQQQPDMPGKAQLIVHEIFGTDPLSEHVLPALQQVQQQLAAPGAVFMPSRVRVVAAVAACPAVMQHLRADGTLQHLPPPAAGAAGTAQTAGAAGTAMPSASNSSCAGVQIPSSSSCGSSNPSASSAQMPAWDVSSLLALQPRKLELQLEDLADQLLLLTQPQPVLELDFQQPIKLSGKQAVQLQALPEGGLLLQEWMQQQHAQEGEEQHVPPSGQEQAVCSSTPAAAATTTSNSTTAGDAGVSAVAAGIAAGAVGSAGLLVVSWFEADCGEGGWLSTEPGKTRLGHWQQSVEFVGSRGSSRGQVGGSSQACAQQAAGSGGESCGSYKLQVSWNHDRVSFALLD